MNAKVTLRKDKKNIHGLCPIIILISEQKKTERIPLHINVNELDFDLKDGVVKKSSPSYKQHIEIIRQAKNRIQETFKHYYNLHNNSSLHINEKQKCEIFKQIYLSLDSELEEVLIKIKDKHELKIEVSEQPGLNEYTIKRTPRIKFEEIPWNIGIPIDKVSEVKRIVLKYLKNEHDEALGKIYNSKDLEEDEEKNIYFLSIWKMYYSYCVLEKEKSTHERIPNNLKILTEFTNCKGINLCFESFTEDFGFQLKHYLLKEHINKYSKEKGVSLLLFLS
jgi:hypothetical protein